MTNQIFKTVIPSDMLFRLLDKICFKTEKYYLFDLNAYRKFLFYHLNIDFCDEIRDHYHIGKRIYIDRKMTYNSFTTIIRQICKSSNIMYTSQIKYNKSKYNIDYFIYF